MATRLTHGFCSLDLIPPSALFCRQCKLYLPQIPPPNFVYLSIYDKVIPPPHEG
jgi:hypothetical protein